MNKEVDFFEKKEKILEKRLAEYLEHNFHRDNRLELNRLVAELAEVNPENRYVYFAKARIQFLLNNPDISLELVDAGLSLDKENELGLLVKRDTLIYLVYPEKRLEYIEDLKETIDSLVRIRPNDPDVLVTASEFYEKEGNDFPRAYSYAKRAYRLDKSYVWRYREAREVIKFIK